jgi:hypothetical protein
MELILLGINCGNRQIQCSFKENKCEFSRDTHNRLREVMVFVARGGGVVRILHGSSIPS